jgi:hypothetical protein
MRTSRDLLESGGCVPELARTLIAWGTYGSEHADPDAADRLRDGARILREAGLER